MVATDISKEDAIALAIKELADDLAGKTVIKEIYVPNKIINFVTK